MWISFMILIAIVVIATIISILLWILSDRYARVFNTILSSICGLFIALMWFLFIFVLSSVSVPTGYASLEKSWGGRYTGKVFTETGRHFWAIAPSYETKRVDIRNNKEAVAVNVMKDKTYNVSASIEVVYDLQPNKLVDLLSNYSDYKNTVIGATVKNVVTSNNTLANSQSLNPKDEKEIENELAKYGVKVTNIYMNSYKLTNSSNYALNANANLNNN
ncbi:hypothetical protein EFL96_12590 [Lactococcus lactis]|uniref:SPFH domain-containing protein n=1 Tax=Lactococcus lactis TaxID=1358 RepID=UPI00223A9E02|nr:hypothetical protein [Lactococcus lactis]MCT1186583.1 hypothetical protein [Lactococcus lactis]MCT1190716.1 hypothetical protein [Lactococcus lactis]